uniref:PWWP domain-containing protein n=1 Tax=Leersia perrieri TaxID=77586 RepID=A0A0D9Y1U9_9ORYZ
MAETLTPQTLAPAPAAGDLVWAKSKRRPWWPARLLPDGRVSYLSAAADDSPCRASDLRPFAHPDADLMARATTARAFVAAVQLAQSHSAALLQAHLTCPCASDSVSPPPSPLPNLPPSAFLDSLRHAALDASSVGLLDLPRLKSWAAAFAQGWGPSGPGRYPRRAVADLVDKIDLDVPAAAWDAQEQDTRAPFDVPQETPTQKKRSVAELMDGNDDDKTQTTMPREGRVDTTTVLSNKRERKKSKYLSPPYTNLGGVALVQKASDSPKQSPPAAAEDDEKVLPKPLQENVAAQEVLLLVRKAGIDVFHRARSMKAVNAFISIYRSSLFVEGADYKSYKAHKCPAENPFANADADSHAALSPSKCVFKRSRKQDQDGIGTSSSTKKEKRGKKSPAPALGCGVTITPAIPIRQVRAEDIRSPAKPGSGPRGMAVCVQLDKSKPDFKIPTPASVKVTKEPVQEQDQANGGSVLKPPADACMNLSDQPAKQNDTGTEEARQLHTNIQAETAAQRIVVDVPVRRVPMEPLKCEANIPVHKDELTTAAVAVTDKSVPLPVSEDVIQSQLTDGNKEHASAEVRTVQESYASLEAMVPEMLMKAETANGTNVAAASNALKDEGQRVEQPSLKKMVHGASVNHSSGEAAISSAFPDLANSTPKKKKKKTAEHFGNPAALLLDFAKGVVLPSKEELLSAFGKFGLLIESETEIVKHTHSARVVFGKSAEAEAAYNSADTLGMFGPPFATPRLHYLPPIKLSVPSPSPKPPLTDIRKNLETMISSLAGHSSVKKAAPSDGSKQMPENLLGDMQGLLAKVNKMLSGPSAGTPH